MQCRVCPHCTCQVWVHPSWQSADVQCWNCRNVVTPANHPIIPVALPVYDEGQEQQTAEVQHLPEGAYNGRRLNCYACGVSIGGDEPRFRRHVYIGTYSSGRGRRSMRTICRRCAAKVDAEAALALKIMTVGVGCLVAAAIAVVVAWAVLNAIT